MVFEGYERLLEVVWGKVDEAHPDHRISRQQVARSTRITDRRSHFRVLFPADHVLHCAWKFDRNDE